MGYVFGVRHSGGCLHIHRADCYHLVKGTKYPPCPIEVAAAVSTVKPSTGFARPIRMIRNPRPVRNLALCGHCIGLEPVV